MLQSSYWNSWKNMTYFTVRTWRATALKWAGVSNFVLGASGVLASHKRSSAILNAPRGTFSFEGPAGKILDARSRAFAHEVRDG